MASEVERPPELVPLFLGRRRRNVFFVLDTSEDTGSVVGLMKDMLIQSLLRKASLKDSLFNIMAFSYEVICWSQHMLPCAPHTVYEALSWIRSLTCSPGKDLQAALSAALMDPACHAVHLLTSGLPEHPEAIIRALPAMAAFGRPLNIFYLLDSSASLNSATQDFLQCLALATRGSCYLLPVGVNGALREVIPLHTDESRTPVPTIPTIESVQSCISPRQHDSLPLLRCSLGMPFSPATSHTLSGSELWGAEYSPGCRVLARKELDGLYYLGTVIQEIRRGLRVVEFDHLGRADSSLNSSKVSQLQLVRSLDMIHHTRAHAHRLVPGDDVLSPWEPDLRRYGPGRVMADMEHSESACNGTGLVVLMWNSCLAHVPRDLAAHITASHHERIVGELQPAAPQSWPRMCSPPGARQTCCAQPCQSAPASCHHPVSCGCLSVVPPVCACHLGSGARFKTAELERKVDLLLQNLKDTQTGRSKSEASAASSSSSAVSEETTALRSPPPFTPRSEQERPPWRYWRRSSPEPQHRKPGIPNSRRAFQPARFGFPVPQVRGALPNHSSLFKPLPGPDGGGVTIRDISQATDFRPRPPVGYFSGQNAAAVHT